jgi:hypothetical protein
MYRVHRRAKNTKYLSDKVYRILSRHLCRHRAFGLRPAGEAGGEAAPASEACRQTRGAGRDGGSCGRTTISTTTYPTNLPTLAPPRVTTSLLQGIPHLQGMIFSFITRCLHYYIFGFHPLSTDKQNIPQVFNSF